MESHKIAQLKPRQAKERNKEQAYEWKTVINMVDTNSTISIMLLTV